MSDFNAAQVLAEAYTLYKKHYDGMGLDFKIAIAQVREESEQRGAVKAIRQFARDYRSFYFSSNDQLQGHLEDRARMIEQENRADQEGDDD